MERIRLLLGSDPSATHKRLDELDTFVTRWLDRPADEFDFTVPTSIPEAKERFRAELAACFELLDSLGQSTGATTVVPDTNVLIRSPDIDRYDRVLGVSAYTVVLVPPVLAELDTLKGAPAPGRRAKACARSPSAARQSGRPLPPTGWTSIWSGMPSSSGIACSTNGRSSGAFSASACASWLVHRSITHTRLGSSVDSLTRYSRQAGLSSKSLPDSSKISTTRRRWPGLAVSRLRSTWDMRCTLSPPSVVVQHEQAGAASSRQVLGSRHG